LIRFCWMFLFVFSDSSIPLLLTTSLWSCDSSLQWRIHVGIAETRWWWFLSESLRTTSNSLNLLNLVAIDCEFFDFWKLGFNEEDEASSSFLWKQFFDSVRGERMGENVFLVMCQWMNGDLWLWLELALFYRCQVCPLPNRILPRVPGLNLDWNNLEDWSAID
jgi:hypothetical protein